ncbi:hypothetical protein [Haloarchaeobius sp. HRN-SO-5]|uniref:hypothetical protein n=1 Tax=Haloarchaeobius sp. HRN-SO-5 TaxID=3446118 RepID=UPI003EBAF344
MVGRYNLTNLKKVIREPEYVLWDIQRSLFDLRHDDGIDVMAEDWDNLLLLDACRYDYFKDQNQIDGTLRPVISRGRRSWEFMQGNFVGKTFHDTVYVTANPHTGKLADDVFHAVEPLYLERWDDEHETVLPGDVVDATLEARTEYPDKRLVVHFMQPHRPYLGPTGEKLQEEYDVRGFNRYVAEKERPSDHRSFSKMVESGTIPVPETRKAYRETLDILLSHVEELVDSIDGKTTISADHGEMLGERLTPLTKPKHGHSFEYLKNEILYEVPWLEIESDERRAITEDEPIQFQRGSDEEIDERLRALGYK